MPYKVNTEQVYSKLMQKTHEQCTILTAFDVNKNKSVFHSFDVYHTFVKYSVDDFHIDTCRCHRSGFLYRIQYSVEN